MIDALKPTVSRLLTTVVLALLSSVPSAIGQVQIPRGTPDPSQRQLIVGEEQPWSKSELPGVRPDRGMSQESLQLIKEAAESNDPDALLRLATLAVSTVDAFEYVRRAAELGNHTAEYELASMYALGTGTAKDMTKALSWARRSADGGNKLARYALERTHLFEPSGELV
jgi:TPR repeat protein